MGKTPAELFQERQKRVNDAIQLKIPDRVPITPLFTFFAAKYGGITFQEAMYNLEKTAEVSRKAILEFDIDEYSNPFLLTSLGPMLEILEDRRAKWPGHGVSPNSTYQYVEAEYMTADEYDSFLNDPTGYVLRTHIPRIFGALESFKDFPDVLGSYYFSLNSALSMPFALPEFSKAVEKLTRTGQEALKMLMRSAAFSREMADLGYPCQFGSIAWAPYDYVGDFYRGTRGIMLDMYQRADKLLAAIDKVTPAIINSAIGMAQMSGVRRAFIPLHKGLDNFMSPTQFDRFFWPGLKQVLLALIDNDIVPVVLWEGDCTSRLETIADIPKGKAVYWFERTSLFKAKEVLKDHVCIRGSMPASILVTGSSEDVKNEIKKVIDIVGKGGGFILDGPIGIPDEAPIENVKALIDFTREYGVYE